MFVKKHPLSSLTMDWTNLVPRVSFVDEERDKDCDNRGPGNEVVDWTSSKHGPSLWTRSMDCPCGPPLILQGYKQKNLSTKEGSGPRTYLENLSNCLLETPENFRWLQRQSRTQSPRAFWQAVERPERLWDNRLHFPRKRGFRSYDVWLSLNGSRKEKTVNSRNGGLKVFEKQEF